MTTTSELFEQWQAARMRIFLARYAHEGPEQTADYWAELRTATAISREVLSGRWVAVAELLRHGAAESWAQLGDALGMTETEVRDGFAWWLSGQVDLYRRTGSIGVPPAEADTLTELAEGVAL
jgi:hypothetical protein